MTEVDYTIDDRTGCWIGKKPVAKGYSAARVDGQTAYAHRVSYEQANGAIPAGLVIDHLCRNRACVNPAHLEAVPQYVNCHRGAKTRLSGEQARAIREEIAVGALTKDVAAKYGVSVTHIHQICKGKRWQTAGGEVAKSLRRRGRIRAIVTAEVEKEIRALRLSGSKLTELAKRFGISVSYVCQIANGYLDRKLGPR